MMAVARAVQNQGVGARLKWAQRERSLSEGRKFIKWTWDPMQARNAHFNLNRLGVTVRALAVNFYGTDYNTTPRGMDAEVHLDSDRLFAGWHLDSTKVNLLAAGGRASEQLSPPARTIEIPPDWSALVARDAAQARAEQLRVRAEFESAFSEGLVCTGFERDEQHPRYLLFRDEG
jgi:predicted GNAT superfamily acetyltransferase